MVGGMMVDEDSVTFARIAQDSAINNFSFSP